MKYRAMKRFYCIFLTLIMCFSLFACSHESSSYIKSWSDSKPSGDLYISAEIVSATTVDIDSEFTVKVGIGSSKEQYTTALFKATAPDFRIITVDDTIFNESYQITYNDFSDPKFGTILNNGITLSHYETLRFKYNGKEQKTWSCIDLRIVAIDAEGNELSGAVVGLYYEVKNGKITVTTKRPNDFSQQEEPTLTAS